VQLIYCDSRSHRGRASASATNGSCTCVVRVLVVSRWAWLLIVSRQSRLTLLAHPHGSKGVTYTLLSHYDVRHGCRRNGSAKPLDWSRDRGGGGRERFWRPGRSAVPLLCPISFGAHPREWIDYVLEFVGQWWTHKGSNLGPLPCEGNALPLSYASGIFVHDQKPASRRPIGNTSPQSRRFTKGRPVLSS
jgi:hypothetical protein